MNSVTIAYLFLPFILTGIFFLWVTKHNLFRSLAKPVHERWFGTNKTWRGFIVAPIAAGTFVSLITFVEPFVALTFRFSEYNAFFLGWMLGLAYMLGELPNSYMKRRLGIPPGKQASKRTWLFSLIDQLDSAPFVILVAWFMTDLSLGFMLVILVFAVVVKFTMNYVLFVLGVRKEPV